MKNVKREWKMEYRGWRISPPALLFSILYLLSSPPLSAAPQAVYVNPDGSIVNTTDFKFKAHKIQICDAAGANCTAIDTDLDGKQPLDFDLTAIAALTTDPFGLQVLTKATAASLRTYIGAGTSSFDGVFASLTGKPTTIAGYGITDFNSLGDARWSLLAHTHTFASLTSKPTTIAGFGITDFNSLGDARWQPLDSDLTAIAALATDPFGLQVLTKATAASLRTYIGAGTSSFDGVFASLTSKPTTIAGYGITDFNPLGDTRWQPLDSDLTAIAALATDSFGLQVLTKATAASLRTYIGAGTSSFDGVFSSLTGKPTTIAGYGITDFNSLGDARWQPLDSDLTTWAGITPASGVGTFLATPTLVNLKAAITDETTVGWNFLTLANPGAITFPKINADNTVTAESATTHRTSLGLGTAATQNTGTSGGNAPLLNAANTWTAGQTQTFGADATNPGFKFAGVASDPSTLSEGAHWARTDLHRLRYYDGTAARSLPTLSDNLSVFAATTSAQLAGVLSDETGSGAAVFANSPALVTPALGTPASGIVTNLTGSLKNTTALSARAYNSANLSISTATLTVVTLDSERWDTDTIHSTSSNTGRLTATTAGIYSISANVQWASNATGNRELLVKLNGATYILDKNSTPVTGAGTLMNVTTQYNLSAGDYVELVAYQDSGGALNILASGNYSPEFMMTRIP